MRIRTKLIIGVILAVAVAVVMGLVLITTARGVHAGITRGKQTGDIMVAVFELKTLTGDFLQYRMPRARKQWLSKHRGVGFELSRVSVENDAQAYLLRHMKEQHQTVGDLFKQLSGDELEDAPFPASPAAIERLQPLIDVTLLSLIAGANRLYDSIYEGIERRQRRAIITLGIASAMLVSIVIGLAGLVSRTVIKRFSKLREGTEIVGRGDLQFRLDINTDDEVGHFASAFDRMTEALRETTASRDELATEIAVRKRVEKQLQKALDLLKDKNQELEQFAYAASHDLQEPLRKITAFGDRLKSVAADRLDEKSLDYMARMLNAAERMKTLIDDILRLSRLSTRAKPFTQVDLDQVLREVISDLEVRIQETNATINADKLPVITAEPTHMRQLFQNLLGNALKFRRDRVPPIIDITAKTVENPDSSEGKTCELTFADNGIGFDPKYADRIFVVFQRLHRRGEFKGTGIGLALCSKIAEIHNGRISAVGKPGEGATFKVELPLTQSPAPAPAPTQSGCPMNPRDNHPI